MTLVSPCGFLAEKAPDTLLNPVASFSGEGEKDALQLLEKCPEMNLRGVMLGHYSNAT